jgi:16S rRNA (adenine1518-N6/adenine1519-N6)-dimethyltransferase
MFPKAKKSFGQNFLADTSVVRRIIHVAEIVPGESVLEIGPGTGVLTHALVAAGAKVMAVEADHDLIAPLRERFGEKITLIEGDALCLFESQKITTPYKLVANIPYNITSSILEHFLTTDRRPSRMVLMVQKEVADRITAKPGDMSLLSVVCQLYADVRRAFNVPRGAFRPIPKVDSAVVVLNLKPNTQNLKPNLESTIALASAGFFARRKQLHNNLASAGFASSTRVREVLKELGLPETARAQELSPEMWVELRARL